MRLALDIRLGSRIGAAGIGAGCGIIVTDNVNGTYTNNFTPPSSYVDNSNGTHTITSPCATTDNANGTYTITPDNHIIAS